MKKRVNVFNDVVIRFDDLEKYRKDIDSGIHRDFQQLCWNCKRSLDLSCSWSSDLVPIKDWKAITSTCNERVSFAILECPLFLPIHEAKEMVCRCCGKEFMSYGNLLCSMECTIDNSGNKR